MESRKFSAMLNRIACSKKPTIVRAQGAALGGGGLTCACDITIAADDASFAMSEAKFGILPSVIGPHAINSIGQKQAKRLTLTATRISAETALSIGMIHQLTTIEHLDSMVDACIAELLACGPKAIDAIKTLYSKLSVEASSENTLELTAQTISRVRSTEEAREGFAAFFNKRKPNWMNRNAGGSLE